LLVAGDWFKAVWCRTHDPALNQQHSNQQQKSGAAAPLVSIPDAAVQAA